MRLYLNRVVALVALLLLTGANVVSEKIGAHVHDKLTRQLGIFGLQLGDEALIRVFKKEAILELWLKPNDSEKFVHFKNYPICKYSGNLGPKLMQGDEQSPEGFYRVTSEQMNPNSAFHLSFNLGYPNQYDQFHQRTGDYLMVHGSCVSTGCYAMGDTQIEEIYYLLSKSFAAGQTEVPVHAFPFRLEDEELALYESNPWYNFWVDLKQGYDRFNATKQNINVDVTDGRYIVY